MDRKQSTGTYQAPLLRQRHKHIRTIYTVIVPLCCLGAIAIRLHQWTAGGGTFQSFGLSGQAAEKAFLQVPSAESALNASRLFASRPHLAGSQEDYETALAFMSILQQELGIQPPAQPPVYPAGSFHSRRATLSIGLVKEPTAWIDVYYPYLSTPKEQRLEILSENGEVQWVADLRERADETDEEAHKFTGAVPAFHGLSPDGDVSGKIIYVGWGRKGDFDALVRKGVDFTGSIVLVRNGRTFRGVKVELAQELGAVGVLMYDDPEDDGTVSETTGYVPYPHGPARNPTSVQRGAVQFLSLYPGDATTPGYPSYKNATRTPPFSIPKIPSLPISRENAQVLLQTLDKGSPLFSSKVHLVNKVDSGYMPIWNVMGVIPGILPDEAIVIGNHRDAWVLGTSDPSSGTASLHEVIRGLGVLLRQGWRPLRTIVIGSWDAEEYGLIGSTEWGEDFSSWIREHVAAYLNLDSSATGSRFRTNASPLLAHFVRNTALDLPHPTRPFPDTLWNATADKGEFLGNVTLSAQDSAGGSIRANSASPGMGSVGVRFMGSGSDYTVFLQHLGVSSTNVQFQSTLQDPVYHYHSLFDTHRWQQLYGDPGLRRHVAVAKHIGLQALRLADSLILPFNTTFYTEEIYSHVDQVEALIEQNAHKVDLTKLRSALRVLHVASITLDVEKHRAELQLRALLQELEDYEPVLDKIIGGVKQIICSIGKIFGRGCSSNSIAGIMPNEADILPFKPRYGRVVGLVREREEALAMEVARWGTKPQPLPPKYLNELRKAVKRVRKANKKLISFERGFISLEGLKGRDFYKHLAYAPGRYLGYGATPLPGLTEALTLDRNTTLAQIEADRLTSLVENITKVIRS